MRELLRDMRYGVRVLLKQPAFTAVAAFSLAVGIGLNTTVFSFVNAILLRDTPVKDPERLVEIYSSASDDFPLLTTSHADYLDLRDGADQLGDVAAHAMVSGIMTSGGRSELVLGETVTANYFDLFGIRPGLGRGFLPEEDVTEGTHPVVVLSYGIWLRQFAGAPDVLGQTIRLSDVPYTVIGVAPEGFTGLIPGFQPEFWVPTMMVESLSFSGVQSASDLSIGNTRIEQRGRRWLFVKGRLAEGATVESAQAQAETIFARLRRDYPDTNDKVKATVLPCSSIRFHPVIDGYIKAASAVLLVAVALVLAIACANVASLLLARGAARRRELAVRSAIGASRGRLIRQLLGESLVLAALGGSLGVLIAFWAGRVLTAQQADSLPVPLHFSFDVDASVLAFAFAASLATAVLFGLAPAWAASRTDLVAALKTDASGAGPGRRRVTLRSVLVVVQLATSLVLLISGALLARGLLAAQATDIGFDPKPISSLSFSLKMNGYDLERATAFRDRVLEQLRGLPGVEAAALASRLPLAPDINMEGVRVRGRHAPDDDATPIDVVWVGPDYFDVVGVPIVEGRAFTDSDREGAPQVMIINQTMARTYWPDRSPIGEQIYVSEYDEPPYEIVGVSRDHKVKSVGETPTPYMHLPALQEPSRSIHLLVRTSGPADAALPTLRKAIVELEPEIVFTDDDPAEAVVQTTVAPTKIGAAVLGLFGTLALVLAAVGLYGVISHSVSSRTREVGVRMALGARPGDVLWLVLRQGLTLALIGIGVGALVSAGVARVLQSLLYGVSAVDPIAYAAAGLVLFAVAAAANLVPARRAARTDPMRTLRNE